MSEEKTTNDGTYLLVFIVLAVMTFAQLALSFSTMEKRLLISMGLATVQVILLSSVFMHLKGSDTLTKISAVAALFFLGLLFLFTITDYLTRQWATY
jgi:cytochrome c oxidase subunit 4